MLPEKRPSASEVLKDVFTKDRIKLIVPNINSIKKETKELKRIVAPIESTNVQRSTTSKLRPTDNLLDSIKNTKLVRQSIIEDEDHDNTDLVSRKTLIMMKPVVITNMRLLKLIMKNASKMTEHSNSNQERMKAQSENLKTEDNEPCNAEANIAKYYNSDEIFRIRKHK